MVIGLFILMVAIFLAAEYFSLSKKISSASKPVLDRQPHPSTSVVERYFHPGHSWAVVQPLAEEVMVGVDDFSQRFLGELDAIKLPQAGSVIRQGEVLVTLQKGARSLSQVAPISGVVAQVNKHLESAPSLVNDSPLEKGWIAKIVPRDLNLELRNLLRGVAAERWQEGVRYHLIHWFSPPVGLAMQDGGRMVDSISDLVADEDWPILVDEFFPRCTNINAHNT